MSLVRHSIRTDFGTARPEQKSRKGLRGRDEREFFSNSILSRFHWFILPFQLPGFARFYSHSIYELDSWNHS